MRCRAWWRALSSAYPHPDFGEGVTAVVVPKKDASAGRKADHRRA
jgi:hypothetical protein